MKRRVATRSWDVIIVVIVFICILLCLVLVYSQLRYEREKASVMRLMSHIYDVTGEFLDNSKLVICRDAYVAKSTYLSVIRNYVNNSNSPLRVSFIGTLSPSTYLLSDEEGIDVVSESDLPELTIVEHPGFDGQCRNISTTFSSFKLTCCDLHHTRFMNHQICDPVHTDMVMCLSEIQKDCDLCVIYVRDDNIRASLLTQLESNHMTVGMSQVKLSTNHDTQLYQRIWQTLLSSAHSSAFLNQQGPYIWIRGVIRSDIVDIIPASVFGASDLYSVVRVSSLSECRTLLSILDSSF